MLDPFSPRWGPHSADILAPHNSTKVNMDIYVGCLLSQTNCASYQEFPVYTSHTPGHWLTELLCQEGKSNQVLSSHPHQGEQKMLWRRLTCQFSVVLFYKYYARQKNFGLHHRHSDHFSFPLSRLDLCVFLIVTIYHLHIPASWGSWHHLDFSRLGPESDKTFNIVNNLILLDQQQYIQGKGKDFYLKK